MADDEFKSLGVMVTPVKQEGVSPFKVTFKVTSSTLAKRFVFDFGDGLTEEGDLIDGRAVVEHTYVFVKTGKYNGTIPPDCDSNDRRWKVPHFNW